MLNNDILRRIRYTFDFSDAEMMEVFKLADLTVTKEQILNWLKKEEEEDFQSLHDIKLATFLNGLIVKKRGKKEGDQPKPEKTLTNNLPTNPYTGYQHTYPQSLPDFQALSARLVGVVAGVDAVLFDFAKQGFLRNVRVQRCLIDAAFEHL